MMSRIIVHTATGPATIQIGKDEISICRCGLSKNHKGLCDKSHLKTRDEEKDKLYVYEEDGSRYAVEEEVDCAEGECDCDDKECQCQE